MAINFTDLFNQLKDQIIKLAKDNFKDLAAEAASDGTTLLHKLEDNIKKYTQQLVDGDITKDDFKLLLLGNEDLVKMTALTQAGLLKAKADAFKKSVFDAIVNTVFAII
jgi:hypothetical protein